MIDPIKSVHALTVHEWAQKNTQDLDFKSLVKIFELALDAVELRSSVTLSRITVSLVLDRALSESKIAFPILANVRVEKGKLDLGSFSAGDLQIDLHALNRALSQVLIDQLTILGNITADILTSPLCKTLMSVTLEKEIEIVKRPNDKKS